VRSIELTKQVGEQREAAWQRTGYAIAIARYAFSVATSPFLYAAHLKSGATAGNRPAGMEKVGSFGEVDQGPRGKNEIALTFDAGAEAECFDDLLTALGFQLVTVSKLLQ
jgi:hypothetical protein